MIKLSLEMIHCYEYVHVSVKVFMESTHLPLPLLPEWQVASYLALVFIFMNFTVSIEVCHSSHMLVCDLSQSMEVFTAVEAFRQNIDIQTKY